MYSTYNEGISVVAERFIRTLKNYIFKYMTAVSKNAYFDMLNCLGVLEEILTLKLIFQIMQEKQISKIFHTLILQLLH